MEKERICVGIDSRSFYSNDIKYTIEIIQLAPAVIPAVSIWAGDNLWPSNTVLFSRGTWNGVAYVSDDDDDPNLYGDNYEKVNSLCQEMVV